MDENRIMVIAALIYAVELDEIVNGLVDDAHDEIARLISQCKA